MQYLAGAAAVQATTLSSESDTDESALPCAIA
jgi:hypothetical protein